MRTKTTKNPKSSGWLAKVSRLLIYTMMFSLVMPQGWYQPKEASAAVANATQWAILGSSATNIAALPAMTLAKGTGTSRLLVVSLVGDFSAAGTTFQPTITYGGQTLLRITSTDTSSRQKVWMGYLNETGIAAATGAPPAFAVSGVAPDTGCGLAAAFYNGVDQTTPVSGSRAVSSDTAATTPTSGAINVNNGGWAIYASNLNTAIASTPPATWPATEHIDTANAALYQFAVNSKTITATGTENPQPTWTTIRYAFLSAALNQVSCTDPDPVTDLTLNPLSSGSVSGTYKVTATVVGESTPNTAGNQTPQALITTTGGDVAGCNVTNQSMTWNATGCGGGGCYEYNWNTTACGTSTADTGVTVQVNYTGPDCTESFSKSSTLVTIDNTGPLSNTLISCSSCHQYTPTFADGTARNSPTGQFQGSHQPHVESYSMPCSDCHTVPGDITPDYFGHRDGNINFQASIKNGTYSKGTSTPQSNTFTGGTCNTTNCHGVNSQAWGTANTGIATCVKCHGVSTTTVASYATDSRTAAPGYNGTGFDTGGVSSPTGTRVGAHDTHLKASNNYSVPIACSSCHTVPATVVTTGADGHLNGGSAEVIFTGLSTSNGAGAGYTTPNCTTTYCHFGKSITAGYAPATANASVSWINTAYLDGTTADCQKCHLSPPSSTGTHASRAFPASCNVCHSHVSTAGVITDPTLHINGAVEYKDDCVECHNTTQGTRSAITTEFGMTATHKKSVNGLATKDDCIVCHMEGDASTRGMSAVHADGKIDLRDPDTGLTIKGVTHSGSASAAGDYVTTTTDATFTKFSRNLGVTLEADPAFLTLGAIMKNHCLKCHDADGATSTSARVPTTGTALRPFGFAVASTATYYLNSIAAGNTAGSVVNVSSSFDPTNASYHPVRGKQNNSYAAGTKMIAPWTATKTAGNNTQYGPLISCWDCHAASGATGTLTRTTTAHGGSAMLRGTWSTTTQTLCTTCHAATYGTSTTNHGTGSSWSTGGASNRYTIANCGTCHGSFNNSKPWLGVDMHGFNLWAELRTDTVTPANSAKSGPTVATGHRPYNFLRTNNMAHFNPNTVPAGDGTWTAAGNKPGCVRASGLCGNAHATTGPGGVY